MAHRLSVSMHKPHISGNSMGVILAISVVLMFAMSFLSAYWFLLGILLVGIITCVFLFKWHTQHKLKFNDLSVLEELKDETPEE